MGNLFYEQLEQESITDRIEYGTDGNSYKLTISNGKEFKQEPKTGHWEWVQYDGNPNIRNWHCSECGRIVSGAITAANPVYTYKYCPNCGARMVEPQENRCADCNHYDVCMSHMKVR